MKNKFILFMFLTLMLISFVHSQEIIDLSKNQDNKINDEGVKLFNPAFMNGANLFGISIALFSFLFSSGDKLTRKNKILLALLSFVYLILSVLAFWFSRLSY